MASTIMLTPAYKNKENAHKTYTAGKTRVNERSYVRAEIGTTRRKMIHQHKDMQLINIFEKCGYCYNCKLLQIKKMCHPRKRQLMSQKQVNRCAQGYADNHTNAKTERSRLKYNSARPDVHKNNPHPCKKKASSEIYACNAAPYICGETHQRAMTSFFNFFLSPTGCAE